MSKDTPDIFKPQTMKRFSPTRQGFEHLTSEDYYEALREGERQALISLNKQLYYYKHRYNGTWNTPENVKLMDEYVLRASREESRTYLVTLPFLEDRWAELLGKVHKFCERKFVAESSYVVETSDSGYKHVHIALLTYDTFRGATTILKWAQSTFKAFEFGPALDVRPNPAAFGYIAKTDAPVTTVRKLPKKAKK